MGLTEGVTMKFLDESQRFDDKSEVHLSWVGDSSTTMHIVWKAASEASAAARFRRSGTGNWEELPSAERASVPTGSVREVSLIGLEPDSAYEYSVETGGDSWTPVRMFRTAGPPKERFAFHAGFVADTGLVGRRDGLANGTERVIASLADYEPLVVLEGGDFAYYDTDRRFSYLNDAIDYFFNQMVPVFGKSPVMPTYGNHELHRALQEEFGPWAERYATPEGPEDRLCYSFDVGHVHFISLCAPHVSDPIPDSRVEWFRQDVEAARESGSEWILPFLHVAPFADGTNHPSNTNLRAQLGPVFEELRIRLALTTHDQAYERTFPLRDVGGADEPTTTALTGYSADEGTVWAKISPGGKISNINGAFSTFAHEEPPHWTAVRSNKAHSYGKLEFDAAGGLTVRVAGVPVNAADAEYFLDEFTFLPA